MIYVTVHPDEHPEACGVHNPDHVEHRMNEALKHSDFCLDCGCEVHPMTDRLYFELAKPDPENECFHPASRVIRPMPSMEHMDKSEWMDTGFLWCTACNLEVVPCHELIDESDGIPI